MSFAAIERMPFMPVGDLEYLGLRASNRKTVLITSCLNEDDSVRWPQ
jgi:hypothetical protein